MSTAAATEVDDHNRRARRGVVQSAVRRRRILLLGRVWLPPSPPPPPPPALARHCRSRWRSGLSGGTSSTSTIPHSTRATSSRRANVVLCPQQQQRRRTYSHLLPRSTWIPQPVAPHGETSARGEAAARCSLHAAICEQCVCFFRTRSLCLRLRCHRYIGEL